MKYVTIVKHSNDRATLSIQEYTTKGKNMVVSNVIHWSVIIGKFEVVAWCDYNLTRNIMRWGTP